MSGGLRIVAAGGLATLQDLGRPGWRRLGVPRSGALEPSLLRIANALCGNAEHAAAIEFFLAGPTLAASDQALRVAVAGDVPLTLTAADGRVQRLASWRSLTLQPGERLKLGVPQRRRVAYVAVAGASVPAQLGSASSYLRAGLGGLRGAALAAGDVVPVLPVAGGAAAVPAGPEWVLNDPPGLSEEPIHVVPGPQDDHFDEAAFAAFFTGPYGVSAEADRMGIRLQGPRLVHRPEKGAEITSDATVPGSIQVPGNGQPIVLLADGQTAGGYPKIATVASADLPRLAVAPVGSLLRFAPVNVQQAEQLARAAEARLAQRIASIRPLRPDGEVDLEALYAANLVSGMVDAPRAP